MGVADALEAETLGTGSLNVTTSEKGRGAGTMGAE